MNDRLNTLNLARMTAEAPGNAAVQTALTKFKPLSPTVIQSHPDACCRVARGWLNGQARVNHALAELPAPWLRARWHWGPLERPIHWCQIMERHTVDCGTLSALTLESLKAVGKPALTVQLVQNYDINMVRDFEYLWRYQGGDYWTSGTLVYHECVAVLDAQGSDIRVWDPTVETFSDGAPLFGHDSIVAIRVIRYDTDPVTCAPQLNWRGFRLTLNEWSIVGQEP
jgi:hypothetical protein